MQLKEEKNYKALMQINKIITYKSFAYLHFGNRSQGCIVFGTKEEAETQSECESNYVNYMLTN